MLRKVWLIIILLSGLPLCGCWPLTDNDNGQPTAGRLIVNIQVDAETDDLDGLTRVVEELKARGIHTTVYVSADYANKYATTINELYRDGFEIALHGYHSGEQLASMTYEDQKTLLEQAKQALEGCQPCGTYKPIVGFRPQYFSQNEDTYRVLDELGLQYNSGFKAGLIPLEGYEDRTVPFAVEGRNFWAVPITVVNDVYLCDMSCKMSADLPYTPEQWSQLLHSAIEQAKQQQEPLVVIIHGWLTGVEEEYQYWQPFVDFLDELADQDPAFVTTQELVELYQDETPAAGE